MRRSPAEIPRRPAASEGDDAADAELKRLYGEPVEREGAGIDAAVRRMTGDR